MEKIVGEKLGEILGVWAKGIHSIILESIQDLESTSWGLVGFKCEPVTSPIEQLFYGAYLIGQHIGADFANPEGENYLSLLPQYQDETTGKYRFDFVINNLKTGKAVGIELDSHKWHEKKKSQTEAEKKRERFLVSQGWKILRFSGSEVYNNPFRVVSEALDESWKLTNDNKQ